MTERFAWRPLGALLVAAAALAACGGSSDDGPGDLVSARSYAAPSAIAADSKLLIHWMTGLSGKPVKATALLFVPRGTAPAGGWPVVAWIHGTTTAGTGAPAATVCSASESATLDGGLTADGFISNYVGTIASLVGAGYAVVAPDLEGLGAQAERDGTPHAYYNLASSGHAVAAAVVAAHKAVPGLSDNWAAVGHSEGGHVALGLETTAGDAKGYNYKGTVALAPFNSIEASVNLLSGLTAADPANVVNYRASQEIFVGLMSTTLATQQSAFQPSAVMGADLLALMPAFRSQCMFPLLGSVITDVATKTPAAFQGYKADWASNPSMSAFLKTNDQAVSTSFRVTKPTLVLQGKADVLVFEALQTGFMNRLTAAGMPVTYTTYPTADHSTVITEGRADMLAFLKKVLP